MTSNGHSLKTVVPEPPGCPDKTEQDRSADVSNRPNSTINNRGSQPYMRIPALEEALIRCKTGKTIDLSETEGDDATRNPVQHLAFIAKFRALMSRIAQSRYLNCIIFTIVFVNGIQMGIQVDHSSADLDKVFLIVDHFFTSVFAAEFCIKVIAMGKHYFLDRWNVFDCLLTWLSITDMWILGAIGMESDMKQVSALRVFRVFRAVRLLRMVRSLKQVTLIVEGLFKAMGTTSWVTVLLLLILYIFSIFCVGAIGRKGTYEGWSDDTMNYDEVVSFNSYQYFGTISRSMYTLLMLAMLTDDWYVVSRALMEKQPEILVFLLLFITFTTFGLLNVIMGIVVESVMDCARVLNKDEVKMDNREMIGRLEGLYDFIGSLDASGDAMIDGAELKRAWTRPEMKELLAMVQLPVGMDADEFLALIDSDGDEELSTQEIIKAMVRLVVNDEDQMRIEMKFNQNRTKVAIREVKLDQDAMKEDIKSLRSDVSQLVAEIRKGSAATPKSGLATCSSTTEIDHSPNGPSGPKVKDTLASTWSSQHSIESVSDLAGLRADVLDMKKMLQNLQSSRSENEELRAELRGIKAMLSSLGATHVPVTASGASGLDGLTVVAEVQEMKRLLNHIFRDTSEPTSLC